MRDSRISRIGTEKLAIADAESIARFMCTLLYKSGVEGGRPVGGTRRCTGNASGLLGGERVWKFSAGGISGRAAWSTCTPLPIAWGWYCENDGKICPGTTPIETLL